MLSAIIGFCIGCLFCFAFVKGFKTLSKAIGDDFGFDLSDLT